MYDVTFGELGKSVLKFFVNFLQLFVSLRLFQNEKLKDKNKLKQKWSTWFSAWSAVYWDGEKCERGKRRKEDQDFALGHIGFEILMKCPSGCVKMAGQALSGHHGWALKTGERYGNHATQPWNGSSAPEVRQDHVCSSMECMRLECLWYNRHSAQHVSLSTTLSSRTYSSQFTKEEADSQKC